MVISPRMSHIVLEWGGLNGGSHTGYCVKRMYQILHQSTNVEVVRLGYFGPFDIPHVHVFVSQVRNLNYELYTADFRKGT